MKKLCLIFILFVLGCGISHAQKRVLLTDRAVINDSLQLSGTWVSEISKDSTFINANHRSVPTTKAVKDYVDSLPGGGSVQSSLLTGNGSEISPLDAYGFYISDAAAASDGVPIGGLYKIQVGNKYGLPYGALRVRIN